MPNKAREHASKALQFQPENVRAHLLMGEILLRDGKTLAALDHFRKASRFAPAGAERDEAAKELARVRREHTEILHNPSAPATDTTGAATWVNKPNGDRPALAVMPFTTSITDSMFASMGATISEMLTTSLINWGTYRVIERRQIDRVLQEQALGQSGALEPETASAVGNLLGVSAVVVGNISKPAAFEADARILSVATGEALAACYAKAATLDQTRKLAESLAAEISEKAGLVQQSVRSDSLKASVPRN
jgi:TolB-like protein